MMKKERSKEMTGTETNSINKMPDVRPAKKLRCTRECEMPWIGYFKSGDIVEDQRKVALIADNPNFEIITEG